MRVPPLLACTLIIFYIYSILYFYLSLSNYSYLSNVIFLTLYSTIPTGASTCITSPTFAPK